MTPPDARLRSALRTRMGFSIAAVVLPLLALLLFERKARRLESLANYGRPAMAFVEHIERSNQSEFSYYTYQVDGVDYRGNVAREDAPYTIGEWFEACYLASDPSLSRPYPDCARAAAEAAGVRSVAWKVVLGLLAVFGLLIFLAHRDVLKLRAGTLPETLDPASYHKRILVMVPLLLLVVLGVSGFHAKDALAKGESLVPVLFAGVLGAVVIGGVSFFIAKDGPVLARARGATIGRSAAAVAMGVAALRLLAFVYQLVSQ